MEQSAPLPIIQVRMGSTRFPGKAIADIAGQPMLWHVVERVRKSQLCDGRVLVATSISAADDEIERLCGQYGIDCFRGSEPDVLDRFYQAAAARSARGVVRITADCPLLDPAVMDKVIDEYLYGEWDYVTNTLRYTYPDGLDVEVFTFDALKAAWNNATLASDREHVTSWIRTSGHFRIRNVESETKLSQGPARWTVDEPADLEFMRAVYTRLDRNGSRFRWQDVMAILDKAPDIASLNQEIISNAGYYRSLLNAPVEPCASRQVVQSLEMKTRAESVIPSCTQTFSKGPSQFVEGVSPIFLDRAKGSKVWDLDGNEYIDYICGLGPIILGHANPVVNAAVSAQMERGVSLSLPSPRETELAELLCEVIPCAEMVRFAKNGSDATAGAVRAARAFTKRDVIACCGYHGWQDWYIGTTTRNKGVPAATSSLTVPFEYNKIETLKAIFERFPGRIAAVIMEPVGVVPPIEGFLEQVRDCTKANGALLIFDEVVTGFRLALAGGQEYFGVTPDLAAFGKAMGNGFPIAAVVGRREVMEIFDEIFFSFTFGGEVASIAAAIATISEMRSRSVIGHLWEQGRKLRDGYNIIAKELNVEKYTKCVGYPPRTVMTFCDDTGTDSLLLKSIFLQEVLVRGLLSGGYQNLSLAHSDADIDFTLRVYGSALRELRRAIDSEDPATCLRGKAVQPVFRRI